MILEITWCDVTSWYLLTAVVTYLLAHFILVVLDLPLREGQKTPDSPSEQHFELRKLLQRILDEVARLPELLNQNGLPQRPEEFLPYFNPKKYEQLLATAVLNKVVENYRNPKNFEHVEEQQQQLAGAEKTGPPTTGATSAGSALATETTFDINHNKVSGKSQLNAANLRRMSLNAEEFRSKDELYDQSLSESDESYLSDYIQKHTVPLPDLSDATGSGPEDDLASVKSNNTDGTWEENWLFRKRQLKSTEASIAMLVPSPTEEVKALIGDKNADEVSDLSEAGSDIEEYDSDSNRKETAAGVSLQSVENSLELGNADDSLMSIHSMSSSEPILSEAKNELLLRENCNHDLSGNNLVDYLVSRAPSVENTEATNSTIVGKEFVEENNNTIQAEKIETDDVKLMQELVVNPNKMSGSISIDNHSVESEHKEKPIDRAQSEPMHQASSSSELANGHEEETTDETLIPGSIAEREHLKWRNASPIPNNPYSPDVLQRRLTESGRKSSLFEVDRSANGTTLVSPSKSPTPVEPLDSTKDEEGDVTEADRSLQSVLGDKPAQYRRYGRDYYINDAKRASGTRKAPDSGVPTTKLSHSTDDEKSLLLSQQQDQPSSLKPKVSSPSHNTSKQQQPLGAFPFVKSSSVGNVSSATRTEDIFSAGRPVEVAPGDPVLKKGTKLDYLSSPTREVYLVPADEPITPRSLESSSEPSMASRPDESLTFSEDSDVTRIYEIGTGESKVMHGNVIDSAKEVSVPSPSTPTNEETQTGEESNSNEEIVEIIPQISTASIESGSVKSTSPVMRRNSVVKTFHAQAKPLAPSTIKFFSPKPFTGSAGSLAGSSPLSMSTAEVRDLPQQPPKHHHSSLHIDFPASRNVPSHDFTIEKEVMEVLPSVKELAKCYSGSQQDVSTDQRPFVKPKEFIRQSTDMLHEEQPPEPRSGMPSVQNKNRRMYCSASNIGAVDEIRRLNLEAYNKPTYVLMAPGHSITARSLSKQIREELKTNVTDDNKVHGGHASPERPCSPIFPPGHLRNSIQFFENLSSK